MMETYIFFVEKRRFLDQLLLALKFLLEDWILKILVRFLVILSMVN